MSALNADKNDLESEYEALLSFMYLSPVGIVRSDKSGRVDMMNPLAAQLLMPLVKGGDIENIFDSLASVAPELRNLVASFEAERGPVCENHRVFVTPARDDAVVLACSIIKVSVDVLMMVLTDISRQVAAERRARQTESWLAGIYTSVNDFAFFTLDAEGCIDSWNPSVERLTGFGEMEVVGHMLSRFYARDEIVLHRSPEHIALTRDEGWHVEEFWCETKTGRRYWGQVLVAVLREDDGDISGYSVVLRDVTERKMHSDNLARLLTTDHLTGVTNRAHFFEIAESEVARAQRHDRALSLVMVDADHFKRINDTAGHQAGDDVLKRIADEAKALLRSSDTVARLGGEEFVLMLPSTTTAEAMVVAERLRVAVERARIDTAVGQWKATISLGVASLGDANPTLQDLLAAADRALYDAKRAGRNCVRGGVAEAKDVAFSDGEEGKAVRI
ncbi:MAG TPA: sensor domain-containing diguanylate cyclase [Paraburkholderia sp.]|uniref:sensor domain-containing diguanylate cyclase n=1 Tax=Paraburkholderia sp. TaxID=1926495 RepID=UPI002CC7430E|nr:sensor domain-containing diguanylate cyclase [Paraburkholderia sp.]HTR10245.1 sensor domain-containing diguanylate cyclase [Paraburkholderia sp.]